MCYQPQVRLQLATTQSIRPRPAVATPASPVHPSIHTHINPWKAWLLQISDLLVMKKRKSTTRQKKWKMKKKPTTLKQTCSEKQFSEWNHQSSMVYFLFRFNIFSKSTTNLKILKEEIKWFEVKCIFLGYLKKKKRSNYFVSMLWMLKWFFIIEEKIGWELSCWNWKWNSSVM